MCVFCLGSLARYWFARKPVCMYIYVCMCSVLGHWRGIGLLVNPYLCIYVCMCSVLGHWRSIGLLVNPYLCIYVCMCSVLGHWRGIGLLVNLNVYMYVCVTSVKKKKIFPTRSSGMVPTKGSLVPLNKRVLSDKK